MWDLFKKSFDAWEDATAKYLEVVLKSPSFLAPSGAMLTMLVKSKAAADDMKTAFWGELGLPTKRDQERTLHLLHKLESRLLDLEEKLESLETDH
ncbi:MAG: hypothetical protein ACXVEF_30385 [Polyangiales bacterium]